MISPSDEERAKQSKVVFDRVKRDSDTVFSSSLIRNASESLGEAKTSLKEHFTGADAARENLGDDKIEVWGRRIGRFFSVIAFIVLAWMLVEHFRK